MNVLFLMEGAAYGGATQMLLWVAKQLQSNGHNVKICVVTESNRASQFMTSLDVINLNFCSRTLHRRGLRESIKIQKEINRVIASFQPDFLVNFGDHSFYYALFAKIFKRKKLIVSERIDPYTNRSKMEIIRRKLYNFSDGCVFQTEYAKKYFSSHLQKKSVVIPNPVKIHTDLTWKWENTEKSIAYVGRLDNKQKRIDILISAFKIVHNEYPDYILKIYGSGADEQKIRTQISECSLEKNVILYGDVSDVLSHIISSKCLILTSDYEGIPNTVIEGMSIGMPVISTDCSPGGAKLLLEEANGFLVERGNVNQLAETIKKVLADGTLATSYADNGKKSLVRFDEKIIAEKWIDFFTMRLV